MSGRTDTLGQLGFDQLLAEAKTENEARVFERETAHLPDNWDEALAYFHALIERHHAAMLAADVAETMRLREEADLLALRLNDGEPGFLANADSAGNVLQRETAAAPGTVPLWGQLGEFTLEVSGTRCANAPAWRVRVRIEMEGVFGIGSGFGFWPGFAAHAVDPDRPFLSEIGYRSFLGTYADPMPGFLPDRLVAEVIALHVEEALHGKLLAIDPRWCSAARVPEGGS